MPNKIKTVFLDVDGVLANFRKGIHDAFNKRYDYSLLSPKWIFWDDWSNVTFEMVNAVCTIPFWQNLEWMHDGLEIFKSICDKFKPEQIYLLTTPMPNVESATGKWLWVKNQLPGFYKRTIITQAPKHLLAKPNTLLIDDKDENIDKFRAAGGKIIMVPRPWNYLYPWSDFSLEVVRSALNCHTV